MTDPALGLVALDTSPPDFSADEAVRMAGELFGIDGAAQRLYGERDQNFRIRPAVGDGIVLKIVGASEDPAVVDFQTTALRHGKGFHYVVPPARPGGLLGTRHERHA